MVHFTPEKEPRLVFLDCGIVYYSKTEAEHNALVEICLAFMQHDGRRAGRLMIDNAPGANQVQHADAFVEAVQGLVVKRYAMCFFVIFSRILVLICVHIRVLPIYIFSHAKPFPTASSPLPRPIFIVIY